MKYILLILLFMSQSISADVFINDKSEYEINPITQSNVRIVYHTGGHSISGLSDNGNVGISCNYSMRPFEKDGAETFAHGVDKVTFKKGYLSNCINTKFDDDISLPYVTRYFNPHNLPLSITVALQPGDSQLIIVDEVKAGRWSLKHTRYTLGRFSCVIEKTSYQAFRLKRLGFGKMIPGLVYSLRAKPYQQSRPVLPYFYCYVGSVEYDSTNF